MMALSHATDSEFSVTSSAASIATQYVDENWTVTFLVAVRAAGAAFVSENYKEAREKYSHCVHLLSEKITDPVCGDLINRLPERHRCLQLFRYACGTAYIRSAVVMEDFKAAMDNFNYICNNDERSTWFPLVCYGYGTVALMQYRYGIARLHFIKGLLALNNERSFLLATLLWPGTSLPIEEFRDAKKFFCAALMCCRYTAPPDGRCAYRSCLSSGNEQREIYLSSVCFKGCKKVTCSDGCIISYHTECWQALKLRKWRKLTDEEILGRSCLTPDCDGKFLSIASLLRKNGKVKLSKISLPPAARLRLGMRVHALQHSTAHDGTSGSLTRSAYPIHDQLKTEQILSEAADKGYEKRTYHGRDLPRSPINMASNLKEKRLRCQMQIALKLGGSAFVHGNYSEARNEYTRCLKWVSSLEPSLQTITDDVNKQAVSVFLLRYATGFACLQKHTELSIMEGIDHFKAIINCSRTDWPMAYYGVGCGLMLLGSYHLAAAELSKGMKMLNQRNSYKEITYYWPGTTLVIPESCELKLRLEKALLASHYPPAPVARCVFERCQSSIYSQREIYDCSCHYEGFISVDCSHKCIINYHIRCWKAAKLLFWGQSTDKSVLGHPCVTPDCGGQLVRITTRKHVDGEDITKEKIDRSSAIADRQKRKVLSGTDLSRTLTTAQGKSSPAAFATATSKEHRRECSESRSELQQSACGNKNSTLRVISASPGASDADSQWVNPTGEESKKNQTTVTTCSHATKTVKFSISDAPILIIKKESDNPENEFQAKAHRKSKTKGTPKGVLRPHVFTRKFDFSEHVWFSSGEQARTEIREAVRNRKDQSSQNTTGVNRLASSEVELPDHAISELIVRFFEEYLKKKPPLHVQDIVITKLLVSMFPPQALDVVSSCGGVGNFFPRYEQFVLIENYIYLKSASLSTAPTTGTSEIVPATIRSDRDLPGDNHDVTQLLTSSDLPEITRNQCMLVPSHFISTSTADTMPVITMHIASNNSAALAASSSTVQSFTSLTPRTTLTFKADVTANPIPLSPVLHVPSGECSSIKKNINFRQLETSSRSVFVDLLGANNQASVHEDATRDCTVRPCDNMFNVLKPEPCSDSKRCYNSFESPNSHSNNQSDCQLLQGSDAKSHVRVAECTLRPFSDAEVQVDGLKEECRLLEQTLATSVTETKMLKAERASLLEEVKREQSLMAAQIVSLRSQVSQLTDDVTRSKREADSYKHELSSLVNCTTQLLRASIVTQEQHMKQWELANREHLTLLTVIERELERLHQKNT